MRAIALHDTRTAELLPLLPRDPGRIGIYACGPTVYSRIHIGNARPFVVFSLMKRFLEHEGYAVTLVVNVTDVNDKIYAAARAAGVPSERLAREMTEAYAADTDALGLGRPDHEPLASETMDAIVDYIEALIDGGHAYESGGDVFFRVRSDPAYGSLSHRRLDDMDQGEEVEGSERKHDPLDFALWKAHKPGEDTSWESPWGRGRPGWHIECSAMAESLLGVGFDIHGGGSDLLFPHHENEAAQTRAARGGELARMWVHNGMIQSTGEKMAKSVGNIAPLHEVLEEWGRDAVVMYLIAGHYRQPLAFGEEPLEQAEANVRRIRDRPVVWSPATPRPTWRRSRIASSRRWPTTSTLRGRSPRHSTGCARPIGVPPRSARAICARCCPSWASTGCSTTRRPHRPPRSCDWPGPGSRRARPATSLPPIACARRSRRSAGKSATAPAGSS